jgi:hypothetical protein
LIIASSSLHPWPTSTRATATAVLECFLEPNNYEKREEEAAGAHLSWDEFVLAVKHPQTGMDAYVYNMTKNFQHEPQQTVLAASKTRRLLPLDHSPSAQRLSASLLRRSPVG